LNEEYAVERFADILRKRIQEREFGTNGIIPSTLELSREWKISRTIVTAVMLLLRSQGHLRFDERSRRYKVNFPVLELEGLTKDFEQYLIENGIDAHIVDMIEPCLERMPADVAALFGQEAGVHVVHRMRKQGTPEQWLRTAENWYPANLAAEFLDEMRANGHMNVVNAIKKKYGLHIVHVEEKVRTRVPHKEEVAFFSIARYEPMFEVIRVSLAQDNKTVIMMNKLIMIGTHFVLTRKYTTNLFE